MFYMIIMMIFLFTTNVYSMICLPILTDKKRERVDNIINIWKDAAHNLTRSGLPSPFLEKFSVETPCIEQILKQGTAFVYWQKVNKKYYEKKTLINPLINVILTKYSI